MCRYHYSKWRVSNGPPCSVDGCDKLRSTRGWCDAHYARWVRNGSPTGGGTIEGEPLKYIEKAARCESDECLPWPYARTSSGYGHVGRKSAHRLVCEAVHGPAPFEKAEARHLCGNGHLGCVNGRHLRWGTRAENQYDRIAHGTSPRGSRNGSTALTEAQVSDLFYRARANESEAALARAFNVSRATVNSIKLGRTWSWLTGANSPAKQLESAR